MRGLLNFFALLVFSGMELSSKLSKNSFEISTKRGAAAIVGFQNRRILLRDDYYSSSMANQNAGFTLVH